jgi:phosphoglycolate phosphatase
MMYKYILWDWNGTLLNDAEVCVNVMNNMLSKRRMPLSDIDNYKKIFGFPVRKYYDQLGFDFNKELFEDVSIEFMDEYQQKSFSAELVKDAECVLKYCRQSGFTQLILSASQIDNLREQVKYFGILSYFDKLLGLDHIHATSKVEIGKTWLKETALNPKELLMIGDTLHDFETATGLGCDIILVADGHQNRERLEGLGVPIVDKISEIKKYLAQNMH